MITTLQRLRKTAVDVWLLAGFVAAFVTHEGPDYGLRSWMGLALVPVVGTPTAARNATALPAFNGEE